MHNKQRNRLVKLASSVSVIIAIIIMSLKTYGWLMTESQSILASLVDSMLDISASVINLIAVRVSLLPPDDNHRFGHEKFQDLAVFSQSIFFLASGMFILFSSGKNLVQGEQLVNHGLGNHIMYICTALTFFLVLFQFYVVKKTASKIIKADKFHYFTDLITNIAVIFSLHLSPVWWFMDGLAGIGISLYVIIGSYKLSREAIGNLVDEEFKAEDKEKILRIVRNNPHCLGIHELKTRYAAHKPFIQFHLELDGNLTLSRAHEIADQLMDVLLLEFPDAEITIHQDPDGLEKNVNYREKI